MKQTINQPLPPLLLTSTGRSRARKRTVTQPPQNAPDAYAMFLKNTSQEGKDDFYMKLAGILLKGKTEVDV
jgi:hypothetical protein